MINNTSNSPSDPNDANRSSEESARAQAQSPKETGKRVMDFISSAMRKGAEDARTAAEAAAPKVKAAVSDAAYWITYGISFAAVFQWTAAKHLAPESCRSGFRDGAKAGRTSAEKWVEKLRQRKESVAAASPSPTEPSAESTQTGAA